MKSKRVYKLLLCLPLVGAAFLSAPRPAKAAIDCQQICARQAANCYRFQSPDSCSEVYDTCYYNCQNPGN
jgi:hypothetical protein